MLDSAVYYLYRAGTALIGLFPLRFLYYVGSAFGFLGWIFLPNYRRLALRSARIAFGASMARWNFCAAVGGSVFSAINTRAITVSGRRSSGGSLRRPSSPRSSRNAPAPPF